MRSSLCDCGWCGVNVEWPLKVMAINALGVGHYRPMADFVRLLLKRSTSVSVVFIAPIRAWESEMCVPLEEHPRLKQVRVHLDGVEIHPITMRGMLTERGPLVDILRRYAKGVDAVVHDAFAVFVPSFVSEEMKVPRYLFSPSNILTSSWLLDHGMRHSLESGVQRYPKAGFKEPIHLQYLWHMIQTNADEPVFCGLRPGDFFKGVTGVVSCDLESVYPEAYTDAVSELVKNLERKGACDHRLRFFPVAPGVVVRPSPISKADKGTFDWLDSQPARSVIFISFGTLYPMPDECLVSLSEALRAVSPWTFLWAYKPRKQTNGSFSSNLSAMSSRKGRVVEWINQAQVLRHPAIRIFVTHGGWNSLTESFTHAGVPLLAVPLGSEQVANALLVSNGLGIGNVALIEDYSSDLQSSQRQTKFRLPSTDEWEELIRKTANDDYEKLRARSEIVKYQTNTSSTLMGATIDKFIRSIKLFPFAALS